MIELYFVVSLLGNVVLIGGPLPVSVKECKSIVSVVAHRAIEKWKVEDKLVIGDETYPIEALTFECMYLNSKDVTP